MDRMAPEKESLKRDWKRLPWFNAETLVQKWLKRQMEARYIKSHTEKDKKECLQARNVYLYKLNRAKCLYLNAAIEDTQGDQWKLFGLLDSLTKEPGGTQCCQAQMHHLWRLCILFGDKTETIYKFLNPEDSLSVPSTFQNNLPRMASFKPVTLSDVRWLLTKEKPITCLSDTIPTMLLTQTQNTSKSLLTINT